MAFLLLLSALLTAPLRAVQVYEVRDAAPRSVVPVVLVPAAPASGLLPAGPALAPAAPALAVEGARLGALPAFISPSRAIAVPLAPGLPAVELGVSRLVSAAVPEAAALQDAATGPAASREGAQRLMDALMGAASKGGSATAQPPASDGPPAGAPPAGGGSGGGKRSQPLLNNVSFSESISPRHRDLLWETLRRRKAAWTKGLPASGVPALDGPVAVRFSVREAKDLTPGAATAVRFVRYVMDWSQSETRLGAFGVTVRLKDLQVLLSSMPAPVPPEEKRLVLRFKAGTPEEAVAEFLEARRLRALWKSHDGLRTVSVTGQDEAEAVGRELTGAGPVLFALPVTLEVPEAEQITVVFKRSIEVEAAPARQVVAIGDEQIADFLREEGLRVLSVSRDGRWRVAGRPGADPRGLARSLATSWLVLYAAPAAHDAPESRQLILRFKKTYSVETGAGTLRGETTDDAVASVFTGNGFQVLVDYGGWTYKVAVGEHEDAAAVARQLKGMVILADAAAVGSVGEERVRAAAETAIFYKSSRYGASEYDRALYEGRLALELDGATRGQLALYDKLCGEAELRGGRFNSWTGD